jgi:hypothetical protein
MFSLEHELSHIVCFVLVSVIIITYFSLLIAAPPLKLIDLPGLDQRIVDDSMVSLGTA